MSIAVAILVFAGVLGITLAARDGDRMPVGDGLIALISSLMLAVVGFIFAEAVLP